MVSITGFIFLLLGFCAAMAAHIVHFVLWQSRIIELDLPEEHPEKKKVATTRSTLKNFYKEVPYRWVGIGVMFIVRIVGVGVKFVLKIVGSAYKKAAPVIKASVSKTWKKLTAPRARKIKRIIPKARQPKRQPDPIQTILLLAEKGKRAPDLLALRNRIAASKEAEFFVPDETPPPPQMSQEEIDALINAVDAASEETTRENPAPAKAEVAPKTIITAADLRLRSADTSIMDRYQKDVEAVEIEAAQTREYHFSKVETRCKKLDAYVKYNDLPDGLFSHDWHVETRAAWEFYCWTHFGMPCDKTSGEADPMTTVEPPSNSEKHLQNSLQDQGAATDTIREEPASEEVLAITDEGEKLPPLAETLETAEETAANALMGSAISELMEQRPANPLTEILQEGSDMDIFQTIANLLGLKTKLKKSPQLDTAVEEAALSTIVLQTARNNNCASTLDNLTVDNRKKFLTEKAILIEDELRVRNLYLGLALKTKELHEQASLPNANSSQFLTAANLRSNANEEADTVPNEAEVEK